MFRGFYYPRFMRRLGRVSANTVAFLFVFVGLTLVVMAVADRLDANVNRFLVGAVGFGFAAMAIPARSLLLRTSDFMFEHRRENLK